MTTTIVSIIAVVLTLLALIGWSILRAASDADDILEDLDSAKTIEIQDDNGRALLTIGLNELQSFAPAVDGVATMDHSFSWYSIG